MEGRFLQADDVEGLRAQAVRAETEGAGIVLLTEGPLGDPIVLAAGLSPFVTRVLVGVRLDLSEDGRHPAVLAREVTSLDRVAGGRSVLCFTAPFNERLLEAIGLCRVMWREGHADSAGPHFPVQSAVNRPRPVGDDSPLVALDLTNGDGPPAFVSGVVDLLVHRTDDPAVCRVERV